MSIKQPEVLPDSAATTDARAEARKRLEMKRKFRSDVVAYVVVNAFLIVAWAIAGAGYFWPGWVLAGWGMFIALDGYRIYLRPPISEADVDEELQRHR